MLKNRKMSEGRERERGAEEGEQGDIQGGLLDEQCGFWRGAACPGPSSEPLLPDSLGFSAVIRLASTSTAWPVRQAGLKVQVWPPKATRRSPSAYTFSTLPTCPRAWGGREGGEGGGDRQRQRHRLIPVQHILS